MTLSRTAQLGQLASRRRFEDEPPSICRANMPTARLHPQPHDHITSGLPAVGLVAPAFGMTPEAMMIYLADHVDPQWLSVASTKVVYESGRELRTGVS